MFEDFLHCAFGSLNAVCVSQVGSPSEQSWTQPGKLVPRTPMLLGRYFPGCSKNWHFLKWSVFQFKYPCSITDGHMFFTNMNIIVWEGILKILLSYVVKTNEEILPRAAMVNDTYKTSYKPMQPSWPKRVTAGLVSILIFTKRGNGVWLCQERC